MADIKIKGRQEMEEEAPLSAEDQTRLERLEQLKAEAVDLARPMVERMQAHNSTKKEDFVVARMGSAFSLR